MVHLQKKKGRRGLSSGSVLYFTANQIREVSGWNHIHSLQRCQKTKMHQILTRFRGSFFVELKYTSTGHGLGTVPIAHYPSVLNFPFSEGTP